MRSKGRTLLLLMALALVVSTASVYASAEAEAEAETDQTMSFRWWGNDARHAATIAAVEAFEAENPGVEVDTQPNPFDGYQTKILIELSSGTAPDLFCFSTEWLPDAAFEADPVMADLYEWDHILDLSFFDPKLLVGGEVNGRLVGVPTGVSGWSYSYNLDAMTEYAEASGAGLPPGPGEIWTVEEFIAYASALKNTLGDEYAMVQPDWNGTVHQLIQTLSEIAGTFYMSPRAELQFTEQDLVETFELFARYTEAGVLPEGELQVEAFSGDGSTYVAAGQWLGFFSWTSNFQGHESVIDGDLGIMAYPVLGENPTHDGIFTRPAQFWVLNENAKNPELAVRLLDFISNDPAGISALGLSRGVPPTSVGQELLAKDGVLTGAADIGTQYLVQSANASYNPFIIIAEVREVLREEYSRFITGRISAEEAAANLMPEFERITSSLRRRLSLD